MSVDDSTAGSAAATEPVRRRDLAVARSLDSARLRSETRVQRFLDAGLELLARPESGNDFTVQEVVDRSGQSLRSFYQYFAGKHDLLLALFDEAILSAADDLEEQIARQDVPLERLHTFVVEYYRICMPAPKGRARKNNLTPAMAEFCHRLLATHQTEASRAFAPLVTMLKNVLDDAASAGEIIAGLDHLEVAGVLLSAIMFNAAYGGTISGNVETRDGDHAAVQLWILLSGGFVKKSTV